MKGEGRERPDEKQPFLRRCVPSPAELVAAVAALYVERALTWTLLAFVGLVGFVIAVWNSPELLAVLLTLLVPSPAFSLLL